MPLTCHQLIKRPRMIRETAHNATAVKGKNPMLKLMQVVNMAPFTRRDQGLMRLVSNELLSAHNELLFEPDEITAATDPFRCYPTYKGPASITINSRDAGIF